MAKTYRVTAPYITVTVPTPDGPTVRGFYEGAVLPDGVSDEAIKHHLDGDMIAATDEPAPEPAPTTPETPPVTPAEPPAQNAVKAEWVDYAVSQGADRADAEAQTKEDLIKAYGGT